MKPPFVKKEIKRIADKLLYKDMLKDKVVTIEEKVAYNMGVMAVADEIGNLLEE